MRNPFWRGTRPLDVGKEAKKEAKDKREEWKDRLTALASKAYQRQNGKTEVEPFNVCQIKH